MVEINDNRSFENRLEIQTFTTAARLKMVACTIILEIGLSRSIIAGQSIVKNASMTVMSKKTMLFYFLFARLL